MMPPSSDVSPHSLTLRSDNTIGSIELEGDSKDGPPG